MIAVIDYGAGNLRSVKNALDHIGEENTVTNDINDILAADKCILPGVGAFGDCMKSLEKYDLIRAIKEFVNMGKPFLGICLGMQLLFEESEESPGVEGLGIFKGRTVRIPKKDNIKIPHMGWNNIKLLKNSAILEGSPFVYFVHSFYVETAEKDLVSAVTDYGTKLNVAVERGNIFATQFHPEKSGKAGLEILKRFASLANSSC